MKIIKNVRIFDFERFIENGFIVYEKKIIKVGPMTEFSNYYSGLQEGNVRNVKELEVIDGRGKLATPGLVNGHAHVYSTFARGMILPFNPITFEDILKQLWWKLDRALTLSDVYYSGVISACEFLKNGVTTVIDHHASGEIIGSLDMLKKSLVNEGGLRGVFCFESSDRFNIEDCLIENMSFNEECMLSKSNDVASMIGMHASFTLSDQSLEFIAKSSKDIPIHIHVAESVDDVTYTLNHYNKKIIPRLDSFGLLRKNSIYAHCLYLDDTEYKRIIETGGVVAINPSSNMNNGVGKPEVSKLETLKVPFFTGTDGLGFSMARDLYNTYFLGHINHPNDYSLLQFRDSMDRLYQFTSDLLGVQLGRIEEGYAADILLHQYESMTPMTKENALGHYVFGLLDHFSPESVITKGVTRIQEYQRVNDIEEQLKEAKEHANQLWNRIS